jgi:hypothetical protein
MQVVEVEVVPDLAHLETVHLEAVVVVEPVDHFHMEVVIMELLIVVVVEVVVLVKVDHLQEYLLVETVVQVLLLLGTNFNS